MEFPQWTEAPNDSQDAIQFLRLDELRDNISEVLFPYLQTNTPYFRIVSWLTWIYSKIEEELSNQTMMARDYVNKSLRYYSVFAVADIVASKARKKYHRGPVGVELLGDRLDALEGKIVDFGHPSFARPPNPTAIYQSRLIAMGLLHQKLQPFSQGRAQSILLASEMGKKLSKAFEKNWANTIQPSKITDERKWTLIKLKELGDRVDLQGLKPDEAESRLLQDAARLTMKNPEMYDDFVSMVEEAVRRSSQANLELSSSDIAKVALYRFISVDEKNKVGIKLKDCEAVSLLAYHELHTHMQFGADAVLNCLVNLAKNSVGGISKDDIIKKSQQFLNPDSVKEIYQEIMDSFSMYHGKFQKGCPIAHGKNGFESTRQELDSSDDYYKKIALGALILLQSAACHELFDPDWLNRILPYHRRVFSAFNFLVEYQALPAKAKARDWLQSVVDLIIIQHDKVADSKGPHAKRIECRNDRIFYRADAPFAEQRGRLTNAVFWLSDIGLIKVNNGFFSAVK
ncbi:MAG: hypothetical protein ACQCN5_08385 [Candidatus Bathyarchaeia archaeon]